MSLFNTETLKLKIKSKFRVGTVIGFFSHMKTKTQLRETFLWLTLMVAMPALLWMQLNKGDKLGYTLDFSSGCFFAIAMGSLLALLYIRISKSHG